MKIHWIFRVVSLFNYQGSVVAAFASDSFILSQLIFIVKHFFKVFEKVFWIVLTICSFQTALLCYHRICGLSTIFFLIVERRWRDLNPRAGRPTYTLSRGASSATWVHLLAWKFATKVLIFHFTHLYFYACALISLSKKILSVNGFFLFFENNFCYCLYSRHN